MSFDLLCVHTAENGIFKVDFFAFCDFLSTSDIRSFLTDFDETCSEFHDFLRTMMYQEVVVAL